MHIAFFTPLPPIQSALADFGEGLAFALVDLPEVSSLDIFVSGEYESDGTAIKSQLTILNHTEYLNRHTNYDVTLYSLGDHGRFHGYMLDYVHRFPGVVILNDTTLHRCILAETLEKHNLQAYMDELAYSYNNDSKKALHIAQQIGARVGNEILLHYPLTERIIDNSQGVIVQNNYALSQVLERRPSTRAQIIPYPFFLPPGFIETDPETLRIQQRATLGLHSDAFVAGSFGIFVPNKHLQACLRAFKEVTRQMPNAHYLLGGFAAKEYDLAGEIKRMGLANQVRITGWQPPADFVRWMFALDVGIHLRYPHIGGTPYTPIRLMGLGITTITSDIEPLQEIPQGTCIKITPDDYAEAILTEILNQLAHNVAWRQLIGENGRSFIQKHHQLEDIARQYVQFFQSL